jgi:hypothetical protein
MRTKLLTTIAAVGLAGSIATQAQIFRNPTRIPFRPIILQPVGTTNIRGILYNDHTRNTSMAPTAVVGGGFFTITCRSLMFSGVPASSLYDIRVILQDTALPPNSGGVIAYRLTNVQPLGTSLTVQAPAIPVLAGRSYHVSVFLIGPQPMHYAYAGVLQLL